MRFESLHLESYGPFRALDLAFDANPGRLNLLLAPNGAGKSVLREAFGDLLFDIGHQSPMTFAYSAAQMRLSATIRLPDGTRQVLERRKGRGNTLSDGTSPIPPENLARMLGGADRQTFADLFALDSHLLREGGLALSRSSGRLGQTLLAGSGGLGRVQALLRALFEERDALGRADHRHQARPLWRAAKDLNDASREMHEAELRPAEWKDLERRAAEAERALAALHEERRAAEAELRRLNLVRAVRPWLLREAEAVATLERAGPVPHFPADFEARWRAALEAKARAAATLAACRRHHEEAKAALGREGVNARLLAAAAEIEALTVAAVGARNAARDLPGVEAEHARARQDVERLRAELGWEETVALPEAPALRAARARLAAHERLAAEMAGNVREQALARSRAEGAAADLAALPEAGDVTELAALLREMRTLGEPVRRLAAAETARADAEAAYRRALLALPGWPPGREGLADTVAPAEEALAAAESALREALEAERDQARQGAARASERGQAEARLASLQREAALPEAEALAAARAARDSLWDEYRRGQGEAVVFERAMRAADAVADTLLAHAAEAAEAGSLRRRLTDLAGTETEAKAAVESLAARRAAAEAALAALATAAGAPAEPGAAGLRAFLPARERALEQEQAWRRAEAAAAALAAELQEAGGRLAVLGAEGENLTVRIAAAEARIAAAQQAEAVRAGAEAALKAARRDYAERSAAASEARERLDAWRQAWCEAARPLARPANEPPEATAAVLDLIEQLRGAEAAAAAGSERIRAMRATVAGIAATAASLAGEVAPELATLPPTEVAVRLAAMLQAERESLARQQAQRNTLKAATEALAVAGQAAERCEQERAVLLATLRAADDAAAEACLESHRAVVKAESERALARAQIATLGEGRTGTELAALAAGESAEAEAARIAALAERQQLLVQAIERAAAEVRSAADARDRARADETLLAASGRRQAALAELVRHTERAALLHAAASLLRAALEAGAEGAGTAAVARAGSLFSDLTCGAYDRLEVLEEENGERLLAALEADGRTRKQINELSEGSQDQMFLALRLAALEDYGKSRPLLPFLADDVLQTFDDARAEAALSALLAFTAHAQVLVLTHHPHLLRLASSLPPGAVHEVRLAEAAAA